MDLQKLFNDLANYGFMDSDIIDEDNSGITNDCIKILNKYKSNQTITHHITTALIDRNYLQYPDDVKGASGYILCFITFNNPLGTL